MTGDDLLQVLATLANPHRLRVVAALAAQRNYVSQLARELDISRALAPGRGHLVAQPVGGSRHAPADPSAYGRHDYPWQPRGVRQGQQRECPRRRAIPPTHSAFVAAWDRATLRDLRGGYLLLPDVIELDKAAAASSIG